MLADAPLAVASLSGASGAGRKESIPLLFCEVQNSVRSYSVPLHRHLSEIGQELALAAGHEVPTAHLSSPEVIDLEKISKPVEIYTRDMRWLEECDVVVAEVSTPSHGVGYEIAVGLAIAGALCNWLYMAQKSREFDLIQFVAVAEELPKGSLRDQVLSEAMGKLLASDPEKAFALATKLGAGANEMGMSNAFAPKTPPRTSTAAK